MSDKPNFNRLSIDKVYGTIYTDTVIADYERGSTFMFASIVANDSVAKAIQFAIKKNISIYDSDARKYLGTRDQDYTVIKTKMQDSDFTHLIVSRKDKCETLNNEGELFDFVIYCENEEDRFSKLYDKLYALTPIPLMPEWMPVLARRLTVGNFMRKINVNTIHSPARMHAYRVVVSKQNISSIVSDMVSSREVSINNTYAKSDIIDCVDGLDSYLNVFGDVLAERIQNSFVPKFNPETDEYSQYVNNYDDSCFYNGINLYKAQKATIQAATNNLNENNVTFVIGEMGCGKTALGAGIAYSHYGKKAGMTNVVMCPSHLTSKWKYEVERLVPNAKGYVVKTIEDLIALDTKINAKVKLEHTFIIISKENAKFSYEERPCAIWSETKRTFVCPECGKILTKKEKRGSGRNSYTEDVKFDETDMLKKYAYNTTCDNKRSIINKNGEREIITCGTTLWAPFNKTERNPKWIKLGATGWVLIDHINSLVNFYSRLPKLDKKQSDLLNKLIEAQNAREDGELFKGIKAPRKYSIAKYIRERYKGKIDYFLADELHQYKGNSKQGQAMADISTAANYFIGLTGTLLNGYADGLFYILYRTLPQLMKAEGYEYSDEMQFMRDYGVIKKESKYNFRAGRVGDKIGMDRETRLAGVSPVVFTKFLLENSVFISLSDMDGGLPQYSEIPIEVEMDDELKEAYNVLDRDLRASCSFGGEGGVKAMGSLLQCLSTYPDMPYNNPPILHPDTQEELVIPPEIAQGTRNKEARLLELVQEKLANGEKVLVYYEWTNKTDLGKKLTDMFKENDIKSALLTSSVSAETREEWIKDKISKGLDVLICNPKLVETGLDLLDFTTIVFYQVGYDIFTLRQASRRSWRLSQTKDIEVYFIYYKDTIQSKAITLMATKLQASMAIEGKFSEEGLRAMSNNENLYTQIANSVVEGIKNTVQIPTLVTERTERVLIEDRVRCSMQSLLLTMPVIHSLDYLRAKTAIKQPKLSSKKSTFSSLLNSTLHIGNLI